MSTSVSVSSALVPPSLAGKAEEINLVLSEPNIDLWKLRELAMSEGGFINDNLRRRAWPKLVGLHDQLSEDKENNTGLLSTSATSSSSRHDEVPGLVGNRTGTSRTGATSNSGPPAGRKHHKTKQNKAIPAAQLFYYIPVIAMVG